MASELAVLMAAYNSEAVIRRAVSSLTGNTYPCDIYIVDDGSRIPVSEVLGNIPNVEIIRFPKNQGLARALNAGLIQILQRGYKYIARMDTDDISYPDRFAKQVAFLEQHPRTGVIGSWGRYFDETTGDTIVIHRTPVKLDAVRRQLFFNSAIIHASAMIRADVLRAVGLYSLDYPAAEDYELFRRISKRCALENIPEVLVDVCESIHGISLSKRRRQVYDRLRIQLKYFEPLQWRAWAGVAKTLLLFLVPLRVVAAIKRAREQRFLRQQGTAT
jgi:GT2 family glycosyltransferase